ncbi:MAG TPA: heme-binding protein [Gemmatimonadaceae bacterium]
MTNVTTFPLTVAALAAVVLAAACTPSGSRPSDTANAKAPRSEAAADCGDLPNTEALKRLLRSAPDSGEAGGLFHGRAEWGAIVNRSGQVCEVVPPSDSSGGYWPGSRTISMAKAFTANGFSTDTLAFSTARLYTLTQPGHSLWGVSQPEPFNPNCLDPKSDAKICGGAIAFGGGVPLYKSGHIVGGLGISGDTPCADHEIAKRIRHMAGLDPKGGPAADDIQYAKADRASIYSHPLCPNTWRNGQHIGDEAPASGY